MVVPTTQPHVKDAPIASAAKKQRQPNSVVLEMWLQNNGRNLYPSRQTKEKLGSEAQMSYGQVARWFANRRRKLKMHTSRNGSPNSSSSSGERRDAPSPADSTEECPGFSPNGGQTATGIFGLAGGETTAKVVDSNNNGGERGIGGEKGVTMLADAGQLVATPPASEKSLFRDPLQTDVFGNHIGSVFDGFNARPTSILTNPFMPIGLNGMDANTLLNPYWWTLFGNHSFPLTQPNLTGNGMFPLFANDHLSNLLLQAQFGQRIPLQQDLDQQLALLKQSTKEKDEEQMMTPNWTYQNGSDIPVEKMVKTELGQSLFDEIMDLEEKESIAVSVLASFAFQRRQLKNEGIEVDA